MLGHTAQQLYEMKVGGNEVEYDEVFSAALFKTFVCRVSRDGVIFGCLDSLD